MDRITPYHLCLLTGTCSMRFCSLASRLLRRSSTMPDSCSRDRLQSWEWIKNHFLSYQSYRVNEDIVITAYYAWNQLAQNVDLQTKQLFKG